MNLEKGKIKNIISLCVFLLIIFICFVMLTYLFRNVQRNTRRNILAYYAEKRDTLDMVIIGGSNVYRYWDPMRAWGDYGFTSYAYAVSDMDGTTMYPGVLDLLKTQSPKVLVVEVRPFLEGKMDGEVNASIRNISDSWDVGIDRMKAVKYISDINNFSFEDRMSLYIDLIQYHDNYSALTDSRHWELIDNRINSSLDCEGFYKGNLMAARYSVRENPTPNLTDGCMPLNEASEKVFVDIIKYCKDKGITLEFVSSPFIYKKEDICQINEMKRIASEYGVDLCNTNLFYEDMDLNYDEDFYNNNHVNIIGSLKYTGFFANYLDEKYDMPDHRTEAAYADWNEIYERYAVEEKQTIDETREKIKNKIEQTNE